MTHVKRWSVEFPGEMLVLEPQILQDALRGYTGTVWVRDSDFMRHLFRVGGEHDPADAESQAAVGRLVALVMDRGRR